VSEMKTVTEKKNNEYNNNRPEITGADINKNKLFEQFTPKFYYPRSHEKSHIEEKGRLTNSHEITNANQRTEITINIGRIVVRSNPRSSGNQFSGQTQISVNPEVFRKHTHQNSPSRSSFILPRVSISDYRRMRAAGIL